MSTYETHSDENLMLEFQGGSRVAFDELYSRYNGPLYGFFRRRVQSPQRAEDLAQEMLPRHNPRLNASANRAHCSAPISTESPSSC